MLNEIATFVCEAELQNISAAAQELRLTVGPGRSKIMYDDQLGVELLNRTARAA